MALLEVQGLEVAFPNPGGGGAALALRGVDLSLDRGERLGVVGESGAGKSMLGFSILNLVADPGRISAGRVLFDGEDIAAMSDAQLRAVRGRRIGMIFQDPMMTLNPVLTIGRQMVESLETHLGLSGAEARERAIAQLRDVAIPSPELRFESHPHELSGGLRQRVVIAIALLCEPELIIADEPTTALDVTIQAEIMALLLRLCRARDLALMLITHDLGVVAETTKRLMVMYAGRAVEEGPTAAVLAGPAHPYTRGLLAALPQRNDRGRRLHQIPGQMPGVLRLPKGCAFHPRCELADARCRDETPDRIDRFTGEGYRAAACFKADLTSPAPSGAAS